MSSGGKNMPEAENGKAVQAMDGPLAKTSRPMQAWWQQPQSRR
jgi:hypothetical protein